jgi:hypothetical protein
LKKYIYLLLLLVIVSCKDATDNVNDIEYCAAYPLKQTINWDYLKDIDFSSLKPVITQNYLKNTSEEKIIYGGLMNILTLKQTIFILMHKREYLIIEVMAQELILMV